MSKGTDDLNDDVDDGIDDETLLLYCYADGLEHAGRTRVERALAGSASLRKRYAKLRDELQSLPDPHVAAPSTAAVQRWHAAFDAVAGPEPAPRSTFSLPSFMIGAAVTAALAIGIGIGLLLDNAASVPPQQPFEQAMPSAQFVRGLEVHFRDSRNSLMQLGDSSDEVRLEELAALINQNRLYQRAAKGSDAEHFARVLRAFNLVLVELASGELSPAEADALRERLLFELDVMLTKLAQRPSEQETVI